MAQKPSNITVLQHDSVPPGGVYANVVNVWHSAFEFTLEFAVRLRPRPDAPAAVQVARVKVPPQVAWQLARIISHHVDSYEEAHGAFTPSPPDQETPL